MNLKELRKNAGVSQQEVAARCDITLRSYQNYESQVHEMGYSTLIKLADYFGCSVDYLLGHETKSIIHLDSFTPNQKKAISMLRHLTDDETLLLLGYLARMTGTPLESLTEESKIKNHYGETKVE